MTITIDVSNWPRTTVLMALLAACQQGNPSSAASADLSATQRTLPPSCAPDSLHPVVAAPAPGLWVSERNAHATRVAAMVGPASADPDHARITRRVESLELHEGAAAIRVATDTASMKLELLPPFRRGARVMDAPASERTQSAAVYAITALVLLASYEPCDASAAEPRIRYLRRDERGGVVTDLMLRRESAQTLERLR